jgi:hypothetical protein
LDIKRTETIKERFIIKNELNQLELDIKKYSKNVIKTEKKIFLA